jgi:hypothetical protein
MVAGFEGPFILDLVGYAAPSLHRLTPNVVEGAFREMGLRPLSKVGAMRLLARRIALRILRNQTGPYEGAAAVAALASRELPKDLEGFQGCVDCIDDPEGPRDRYERLIIELAWEQVEGDPSR